MLVHPTLLQVFALQKENLRRENFSSILNLSFLISGFFYVKLTTIRKKYAELTARCLYINVGLLKTLNTQKK
jgi:hypothetical protein